MFGFKSLAKTATEMANDVEAAGYAVDASYGEQEVKIVRMSDMKVMTLLEDGAAIEFIDYAESLATDSGIDFATATLAEAKSYVDTYDCVED